ncbi:MAG: aspartate carbamoyltransferase [Deltaproteobacteria bacterium]|nr:aspartate carbamoyltransferase [Deltaproteobacteria bacterium]
MKRDLISIADLGRPDLLRYLEQAAHVEALPAASKSRLLTGRVLAVLFFEPSTRTRLSFEAAMARLGGSVLGFAEATTASVVKGESLRDTARTVERYADILAIRHPREGAARVVAEATGIPIVNAGDGTNQHPSQTLLDLYTLKKYFGTLDGLKIALAGDLKYSRTVHSLVQALALFDAVEFTLVSPPMLRLPEYLRESGPAARAKFAETEVLDDAVERCNVVYMTRVQKERFPDLLEYEKVKDAYCIDARLLQHAAPGLKIMHPLPRVNEIHADVDQTPHAGYFDQVANGVIMRQAIMLDLLGVTP